MGLYSKQVLTATRKKHDSLNQELLRTCTAIITTCAFQLTQAQEQNNFKQMAIKFKSQYEYVCYKKINKSTKNKEEKKDVFSEE